MNRKIIRNALTNAGATAVYVVLVASFLSNIEKIFKGLEPKDTFLAPAVMLLLLVVSASVTGFLVFGKPLMWYVDGKKKEAVSLLGLTISFLILVALFFILILYKI